MVTHISTEASPRSDGANRVSHTPRIISYHAVVTNKRLKADCIPALGGVLSVEISGTLGETSASKNRLAPGDVIDVPINERQYLNYAQGNCIIVNRMGPVYFV